MKVALHIHTHQVGMEGLYDHCGNAQGLPDYCLSVERVPLSLDEGGLKSIRWPRWDEAKELGESLKVQRLEVLSSIISDLGA